jgi:hypothetical protein
MLIYAYQDPTPLYEVATNAHDRPRSLLHGLHLHFHDQCLAPQVTIQLFVSFLLACLPIRSRRMFLLLQYVLQMITVATSDTLYLDVGSSFLSFVNLVELTE